MNMEAELKNVNEQLKDNKLEKFATACDTAGTKMESFGKKMSVVSAGIAGIGAASIKAFTELDEGYDTIVTKTGATGKALEGLTKSADNVFGTMPEDMSTVGEAIGEVNTRFHTTGTELEKTSKQFVQFASINGTNVTQSVDQVDKIMKAWNVDASQTGNLLGLLTAKAQETGISVDTLEGYVLDNNAQFKEMGLSLPQAINLMAQFDANGVDSTQAMAGLKKAFRYLTSDAYLLEGDILLNDNAHVATNLTDGAKSSGTGASNTTTVKSNAKVDVAHGFNKSLAGTYKVTASGLNLRAGAGTGKSILAVMKNGEKVQCYGYYNDCNGVKWLYVVYKNIVGYASSKYLSK